MLGTGDTYEAIATLADAISGGPKSLIKKMPEYRQDRTIGSWGQESFAAAIGFAYDEGHLRFADWRDFQTGKIAAPDVPRLKATYILNASEVSRRRIALAGQRLADLLKKAL